MNNTTSWQFGHGSSPQQTPLTTTSSNTRTKLPQPLSNTTPTTHIDLNVMKYVNDQLNDAFDVTKSLPLNKINPDNLINPLSFCLCSTPCSCVILEYIRLGDWKRLHRHLTYYTGKYTQFLQFCSTMAMSLDELINTTDCLACTPILNPSPPPPSSSSIPSFPNTISTFKPVGKRIINDDIAPIYGFDSKDPQNSQNSGENHLDCPNLDQNAQNVRNVQNESILYTQVTNFSTIKQPYSPPQPLAGPYTIAYNHHPLSIGSAIYQFDPLYIPIHQQDKLFSILHESSLCLPPHNDQSTHQKDEFIFQNDGNNENNLKGSTVPSISTPSASSTNSIITNPLPSQLSYQTQPVLYPRPSWLSILHSTPPHLPLPSSYPNHFTQFNLTHKSLLNSDYITPLMLAVLLHRPKCIEVLVYHGASLNLTIPLPLPLVHDKQLLSPILSRIDPAQKNQHPIISPNNTSHFPIHPHPRMRYNALDIAIMSLYSIDRGVNDFTMILILLLWYQIDIPMWTIDHFGNNLIQRLIISYNPYVPSIADKQYFPLNTYYSSYFHWVLGIILHRSTWFDPYHRNNAGHLMLDVVSRQFSMHTLSKDELILYYQQYSIDSLVRTEGYGDVGHHPNPTSNAPVSNGAKHSKDHISTAPDMVNVDSDTLKRVYDESQAITQLTRPLNLSIVLSMKAMVIEDKETGQYTFSYGGGGGNIGKIDQGNQDKKSGKNMTNDQKDDLSDLIPTQGSAGANVASTLKNQGTDPSKYYRPIKRKYTSLGAFSDLFLPPPIIKLMQNPITNNDSYDNTSPHLIEHFVADGKLKTGVSDQTRGNKNANDPHSLPASIYSPIIQSLAPFPSKNLLYDEKSALICDRSIISPSKMWIFSSFLKDLMPTLLKKPQQNSISSRPITIFHPRPPSYLVPPHFLQSGSSVNSDGRDEYDIVDQWRFGPIQVLKDDQNEGKYLSPTTNKTLLMLLIEDDQHDNHIMDELRKEQLVLAERLQQEYVYLTNRYLFFNNQNLLLLQPTTDSTDHLHSSPGNDKMTRTDRLIAAKTANALGNTASGGDQSAQAKTEKEQLQQLSIILSQHLSPTSLQSHPGHMHNPLEQSKTKILLLLSTVNLHLMQKRREKRILFIDLLISSLRTTQLPITSPTSNSLSQTKPQTRSLFDLVDSLGAAAVSDSPKNQDSNNLLFVSPTLSPSLSLFAQLEHRDFIGFHAFDHLSSTHNSLPVLDIVTTAYLSYPATNRSYQHRILKKSNLPIGTPTSPKQPNNPKSTTSLIKNMQEDHILGADYVILLMPNEYGEDSLDIAIFTQDVFKQQVLSTINIHSSRSTTASGPNENVPIGSNGNNATEVGKPTPASGGAAGIGINGYIHSPQYLTQNKGVFDSCGNDISNPNYRSPRLSITSTTETTNVAIMMRRVKGMSFIERKYRMLRRAMKIIAQIIKNQAQIDQKSGKNHHHHSVFYKDPQNDSHPGGSKGNGDLDDDISVYDEYKNLNNLSCTTFHEIKKRKAYSPQLIYTALLSLPWLYRQNPHRYSITDVLQGIVPQKHCCVVNQLQNQPNQQSSKVGNNGSNNSVSPTLNTPSSISPRTNNHDFNNSPTSFPTPFSPLDSPNFNTPPVPTNTSMLEFEYKWWKLTLPLSKVLNPILTLHAASNSLYAFAVSHGIDIQSYLTPFPVLRSPFSNQNPLISPSLGESIQFPSTQCRLLPGHHIDTMTMRYLTPDDPFEKTGNGNLSPGQSSDNSSNNNLSKASKNDNDTTKSNPFSNLLFNPLTSLNDDSIQINNLYTILNLFLHTWRLRQTIVNDIDLNLYSNFEEKRNFDVIPWSIITSPCSPSMFPSANPSECMSSPPTSHGHGRKLSERDHGEPNSDHFDRFELASSYHQHNHEWLTSSPSFPNRTIFQLILRIFPGYTPPIKLNSGGVDLGKGQSGKKNNSQTDEKSIQDQEGLHFDSQSNRFVSHTELASIEQAHLDKAYRKKSNKAEIELRVLILKRFFTIFSHSNDQIWLDYQQRQNSLRNDPNYMYCPTAKDIHTVERFVNKHQRRRIARDSANSTRGNSLNSPNSVNSAPQLLSQPYNIHSNSNLPQMSNNNSSGKNKFSSGLPSIPQDEPLGAPPLASSSNFISLSALTSSPTSPLYRPDDDSQFPILPYVPESYLRPYVYDDIGDSISNVSKRMRLFSSCLDGNGRVLLPSPLNHTPSYLTDDNGYTGIFPPSSGAWNSISALPRWYSFRSPSASLSPSLASPQQSYPSTTSAPSCLYPPSTPSQEESLVHYSVSSPNQSAHSSPNQSYFSPSLSSPSSTRLVLSSTTTGLITPFIQLGFDSIEALMIPKEHFHSVDVHHNLFKPPSFLLSPSQISPFSSILDVITVPITTIKNQLQTLQEPTFLNSPYYLDHLKLLFSSPYHTIPSSVIYHQTSSPKKTPSQCPDLTFSDPFSFFRTRFESFSLFSALQSIFRVEIMSFFALRDQYNLITQRQHGTKVGSKVRGGVMTRQSTSSFMKLSQQQSPPTGNFPQGLSPPVSPIMTGIVTTDAKQSGQKMSFPSIIVPTNQATSNEPYQYRQDKPLVFRSPSQRQSEEMIISPNTQQPPEDPGAPSFLDRRELERVLLRDLESNRVFQQNLPFLIYSLNQLLIGWAHALLLLGSNPNTFTFVGLPSGRRGKGNNASTEQLSLPLSAVQIALRSFCTPTSHNTFTQSSSFSPLVRSYSQPGGIVHVDHGLEQGLNYVASQFSKLLLSHGSYLFPQSPAIPTILLKSSFMSSPTLQQSVPGLTLTQLIFSRTNLPHLELLKFVNNIDFSHLNKPVGGFIESKWMKSGGKGISDRNDGSEIGREWYEKLLTTSPGQSIADQQPQFQHKLVSSGHTPLHIASRHTGTTWTVPQNSSNNNPSSNPLHALSPTIAFLLNNKAYIDVADEESGVSPLQLLMSHHQHK